MWHTAFCRRKCQPNAWNPPVHNNDSRGAAARCLAKARSITIRFIARKRVGYFTGGAVSPKKLANDDSRSKGPLVRQLIGDAVVYPTPFFLAYLESLGVRTIVVPRI